MREETGDGKRRTICAPELQNKTTEKSDVIGQETGANGENWQHINSLHVLRLWFLCKVNNLRLYLKNQMADAGEIDTPTQKTQLLVWKVHSLLNIINVIAIYFQFQKHSLHQVNIYCMILMFILDKENH